jgi:hypothetical protein
MGNARPCFYTRDKTKWSPRDSIKPNKEEGSLSRPHPPLQVSPRLLCYRLSLPKTYFEARPPSGSPHMNHHQHRHWLESSLWTLVFFRGFSQSSLFLATFLHFLSPRVLLSWITQFFRLSLGLAIFLVPSSLVSDTFTALLFFIRIILL